MDMVSALIGAFVHRICAEIEKCPITTVFTEPMDAMNAFLAVTNGIGRLQQTWMHYAEIFRDSKRMKYVCLGPIRNRKWEPSNRTCWITLLTT